MLAQYNSIAQISMLMMAVLLLFLMGNTHPRRTTIYHIDILGAVLSIAAILLYRGATDLVRTTTGFLVPLFSILCVSYYLVYIAILNLLFFYIDMLSYKRRSQKKQAILMCAVMTVVYLGMFLYAFFGKKMFLQFRGGGVRLTPYFNIYIWMGILDCVVIFLAGLSNRKTIAKPIFRFMMLFIPLACLSLYLQWQNPYHRFDAVTFVLPFFLFYIMFHSNPYDEISGTQTQASYYHHVQDMLRRKRHFAVLCARFPMYSLIEDNGMSTEIGYLLSERCREIESLKRDIRLYSLNEYTFTCLVPFQEGEEKVTLVQQILAMMAKPIALNGKPYSPHYKIIVFEDMEILSSTTKLKAFQHYLFAKCRKDVSNEVYQAAEKDYADFAQQERVEKLLRNIQLRGDLNDEHIICLTQPIFHVESGSFRTAEALMRMTMDGKPIFPDLFIPLAERTNSIHMLTLIILNKVCQEIHAMGDRYAFDAITVNCSTKEFSDPHLHEELLAIIDQNEVPHEKICLELTESAMFEDYDAVYYNIEKLRAAGVQFYLDDFGTGYSNLERIITCPFKTIKFDKALLYKSMDDTAVDALVQSMVSVFKKQGFQLLVEGVEDEEQLNYSMDKGFQFIQGYHYAKPVPIRELSSYFKEIEPEEEK